MEYNKLTPQEEAIIVHKGTEMPGTGEYYQHFDSGIYVCRRCHAPLYRSRDKFKADCGWPSFDQEIANAVIRQPDKYLNAIEIICAHCQGHLGHVFTGELYTEKNTRHCVNSLSLKFIPQKDE